MGWKGHKSLHRHTGDQDYDWFGYTCGHCGHKTSGAVLASYSHYSAPSVRLLLCVECERGSVWHLSNQLVIPGTRPGPSLLGLPTEVAAAYDEAQKSMSVGAFVATELVCRKILMHVAVDKGAKEGQNFVEYLTYLEKQGYVTPPMKAWVDLIRSHGNKAAHKLEPPDPIRAESTLLLTAELLRLIYEMDHYSQKYSPKP